MIEPLLQLIVLFFVILDPPASMAFFLSATGNLSRIERSKTAGLAVLVAAGVSFGVLMLGQKFLELFSTNIEDFRVAGGIILGILGMKMAMGYSLATANIKEGSSRAIAVLIGTPLLTGPATISAIIFSVHDYGKVLTGAAISVVLAITAILFYMANNLKPLRNKVFLQILTTIFGLIIIAWGIRFVRVGLGI